MRKVFRRVGVVAPLLAVLMLVGGGYAFAVDNPVGGIVPDVSFLTSGPLSGSWRRFFAVFLGALSAGMGFKIGLAIYHMKADERRGMAGGAASAAGDVGTEMGKLVALSVLPGIVAVALWIAG